MSEMSRQFREKLTPKKVANICINIMRSHFNRNNYLPTEEFSKFFAMLLDGIEYDIVENAVLKDKQFWDYMIALENPTLAKRMAYLVASDYFDIAKFIDVAQRERCDAQLMKDFFFSWAYAKYARSMPSCVNS